MSDWSHFNLYCLNYHKPLLSIYYVPNAVLAGAVEMSKTKPMSLRASGYSHPKLKLLNNYLCHGWKLHKEGEIKSLSESGDADRGGNTWCLTEQADQMGRERAFEPRKSVELQIKGTFRYGSQYGCLVWGEKRWESLLVSQTTDI